MPSFEQVIELNLKQLPAKKAKEQHIKIAKEVLHRYLAKSGDKPEYKIFVDGFPAANENGVKPFGVISYVFLRWGQIGRFAINTARDLSPVQSGRYKASWILVADRAQVSETSVPNNIDELILVNTQPYARKIHVRGARLRRVPPGIVERVRLITRRKFGTTFEIQMKYITLSGAYILQRDYIQIRRNGRKRLHTKAGSELTYPALVITRKA